MPSDGYNLLFTAKGVMAIVPHLYPSVKYTPLKDFKSIVEVLTVPHIITANLKTPYNTLGEMVAYAKLNAGKIDYASTGVGSQPHVALESWARRLGIKLTHIPYKSNPSPDVMSGVASLYLEAATTAIPSIQGFKKLQQQSLFPKCAYLHQLFRALKLFASAKTTQITQLKWVGLCPMNQSSF
jgi:tripartite-type tricarboxylate transporter receptor subunit TctC